MESFMAHATEVLLAYMRAKRISPDFKHGQLAVGLEIVSLIRTLESFPVVNEEEREGTVATLHTLLREQGLENAYETYEMLSEWRSVKIVDSSFSPQATGGVYVQQHAGRSASELASSARAALSSEPSRRGMQRELPSGRPNPEQDASSTREQSGSSGESERGTPSE
jgi:hypothetical protein